MVFQLLLAIFIIRFITLFAFGLGVDEAHYMLYARYLDWSYFDHPPLVGWTHFVFNTLFGEGLFAARFPAFMIGIIASIYLYYFLKHLFSEKFAAFGVLALNLSVMVNAMFMFLLPETFLMWFVFPVMYYAVKIEKAPTLTNYLLFGLWLGLMGLAKYSAIFFVLPILLYYVIKKRWDLIWSYKTIFVVLIGLVMVSPVIYWNVQHDFISFTYQGDHLGGGGFDIKRFFQSLGGQMSYSPLLFIIAVYGFIISLLSVVKQRDLTLLLPVLIGLSFAGVFIYFSFFDTVLPHWSAVFYMLFIPIGAVLLYERRRKLTLWLVAISGVLLVMIFAELNLKLFPYKDFKTSFRDILGWDVMMDRAQEIVAAHPGDKKALAVANWTQGSRAMYYYHGTEPVVVLDSRYDQFDMWHAPESFKGYDVLLIDTRFKQFDKKQLPCQRIVPAGESTAWLGDVKINEAHFFWCEGYGTTPPSH